MTGKAQIIEKGYTTVNDLQLYYEIYGNGKPLVLIHGGGSTIDTTFGRVIPQLAKKYRLICMELQAHGRSGDRPAPISFKQDADDLVALLDFLQYDKVDILGFSNGGMTALKMAIHYPRRCNKVVAGSVLLKRDGAFPLFWEFMQKGTFDQMPQAYKDAFLQVNPDPARLYNLFQKCADRMIHFTDYSDEELATIQSPVLLINGD